MIILDLHFCKFLKPHVNFSGFLCYLTPELSKKSDYCPSMSKTGQCLKTLNGGNLGTVQEFWDSSGFLGQDSVENLLKFKRNFLNKN